MGIGKQAKVVSKQQVSAMRLYLRGRRNGLRNETIFLLSVKAGLRAKEIAALEWSMVLDASGAIGGSINLTNRASKGQSGRVIPLHRDIRDNLEQMLDEISDRDCFSSSSRVVVSERSREVSSHVVVNMFRVWYRDLGLDGCSSHSGRRTFITNTARLISTVGGSLRDVQMMAGHASLVMTQTYIEADSKSQSKVVGLL